MSLFTKTADDVFAPYNSDGSPREIVPQEAQVWGTEAERLIASFQAGGGIIFPDKATLDAALNYAPNQMAWVIGDATVENNGVYRKVGTSGTGSWQRLGDLPYSYIKATDVGDGTPNAIQASTSIPVSGSALIWMNVFEANTASPVTVSFNGGTALTIKTNAGNDVAVGGLTAGMIVMGIVSGSTFRLVSDQASAAILAQAEAYASAAAAAANAGFVFDTEAEFEAANIPVVLMFVDTAGYFDPGDGGGQIKKRIAAPPVPGPWHKQSGDGAWWENSSQELTLRMFGAIGNYNPVTRIGANDTAAVDAAFEAAVTLGRKLLMGPGVFYHLGELEYGSARVIGENMWASQFYFEIDNTMAGARLQAQRGYGQDFGVLVYMTAALGPDDGEFGSGFTFSQYYTDGEPIDTRDYAFRRIGFWKAPGSPFSPAHAFNGVGRFANVYGENLYIEGFAGSALHFHWGANAVGVDLPVVATYHPNEIRVTGVTVKDCGRIFTLSSCYDVTLSGLRGTCKRLGDIIPGDETNAYATADEKPLVGGSIHISDFFVTEAQLVSGLGSLRITSLGTSRADDDVETGLGTRRLLYWKHVLVENGKIVGADNVERAIDLTNAVGNITVRNVDVSEVARAALGLRVADTRGNITIDNVSIGSALGIEWLRAWGAKCINMDLNMKNRTGLSGDLIALSVNGSEVTKILANNKNAGDTSITLTATVGLALNPGDTIIVNGNHVKVAGTRQIRSTETVIPIEAMPWTATAGQSVYIDQRSVPKIHSSKIDSYDFGVSMSSCKRIEFILLDLVDVAKTGITGVAKRGDIIACKFIRGGQYRLTDSGYASRNLVLSAGSEGINFERCKFGVDANYIDVCAVTSADTGNLRGRDNEFDKFITAPATFASQSAGRVSAGQLNEYSGNYKTAGGAVP